MKYLVFSPQYETGGDYYDPPEPTCDCVEVEAGNKREAFCKALPLLDQVVNGWTQQQREDGKNPFVGLKLELLDR